MTLCTPPMAAGLPFTVAVLPRWRAAYAATRLIGDVPYKRYAFLLIGTGNGGVEHLNSASIAFNGNGLNSEADYRTWLS